MRTVLSDEFGPTSTLRVRANIRLLIDLGADPQLCKDEEIQRIETLLDMSSDNCKTVATLQTLVDLFAHVEQKSFRDKISELKELIAGGANPDLCCNRDKYKIASLLALSREDIDDMDKIRKRRLASQAEWEKGPI